MGVVRITFIFLSLNFTKLPVPLIFSIISGNLKKINKKQRMLINVPNLTKRSNRQRYKGEIETTSVPWNFLQESIFTFKM